MKDIRPEFTPEEYDGLKAEADRLELTMARLEEITADFISQVLKGAA